MGKISLLRLPDVRARTGLSRSGVYVAVSRGELGAPIKLSARASAWPSTAVDDFIRKKIEAGRQQQVVRADAVRKP